MKGSRVPLFGHKINLAAGKSNLIMDCKVLKGNPADKTLYQTTINSIISNYRIIPRDSTTDGGYACIKNQHYAQEIGIKNIVFNKVVGSMQNIVSSQNMETRLKKWRSAMEAIISNVKRGFNIARCNWKGWAHFRAKVLWSVIAYNIRVLTSYYIKQIETAVPTS